MKKILLVLIAVALSSGAFAQFSWGLKVGASSNNFSFDYSDISVDNAVEAATNASWGFHGGAFFRISALGILIQPEVLFSMTSNDLMITDAANPAGIVETQEFKRLDVPLLLGFKLGPARIMAGPVASVAIGSPEEIFTNTEDLYKGATFGGQAGLGLDLFNKITIDVRYEFGLTNFADEFVVDGVPITLEENKASAIVISAGIMF
jgi:hypothetical protein